MTKNIFIQLFQDKSGASALEYGLLASLIAVVLIGSLTFLGDRLTGTFNAIGDAVENAQTTGAAGAGNTGG
jgi:pilus assembly protein Flp/PilA